MNEPEYERTYDASDNHDELEYVYYLWTRTKEQGSIQREQKSSAQREEPVQQTETFWWNAKTGQRSKPSTTKRVPVSLLRATGTKAADWTKRQSPEPRKRKVEGTSKGPREMALFGLRKTLQGISDQAHLDTIAYNLRYNLTRGNTK